MGIQNKCLRIISKLRLMGLLFMLFMPFFGIGQSNEPDQKTKKVVGQQNLAIDLGIFLEGYVNFIGQTECLTFGIEKKRQRLLIGPTFGKNIFYSEPNQPFGLTGFMVDYSFVFLQPFKQFGIAVTCQFQYYYQDRVVYYEPPAETLILNSKYQESMFLLFGFEPRVNIFKNFQLIGKYGLGIENRTTQTHYPYYPPYNKYGNRTFLCGYLSVGINYAFPVRRKFSEQ